MAQILIPVPPAANTLRDVGHSTSLLGPPVSSCAKRVVRTGGSPRPLPSLRFRDRNVKFSMQGFRGHVLLNFKTRRSALLGL